MAQDISIGIFNGYINLIEGHYDSDSLTSIRLLQYLLLYRYDCPGLSRGPECSATLVQVVAREHSDKLLTIQLAIMAGEIVPKLMLCWREVFNNLANERLKHDMVHSGRCMDADDS